MSLKSLTNTNEELNSAIKVTSNYITKVAIVGAGGNSGKFMTEALLRTDKHTVTAITRPDSKSKLPEGVIPKVVDYEKPETIVEALKGQDALVITLGAFALSNEVKLIVAADEAGVQWILPNEWSTYPGAHELIKDMLFYQMKISTGFWYEWSLPMPSAFGFDIINRSVTFFDDGEAKISVSTWPQVGRAVAALLGLPINAEGGRGDGSLESLNNKDVYINSFTINQTEMLESLLRVTGTKSEDWNITKVPADERLAEGLKEIQEGKHSGFAKKLYTRAFYPDGFGDFEHNEGTLNSLLGLPKEDLDEATKVAVERAGLPQWAGE
ncbi:conserved hypothetical protein [Talaromyces stipitatus ATCC 10500]|uniref:NAD(P)-binding domain-containing protein n=1 Tax=Talaromyces stipitatus (strain ATCC 10500 / CBS 375.48 / QM 6759 / NRRL 1006) TaxID=441959 RepID=B8M3Z3_TALSN|nr:uncharacterized protein TSTA_039360 [Talaromyces stipitatus ATCC 10500]EED20736.1 conserved hypothetical protein [Talaromyces stipitatus ATCC 10500]